MAQISQANKAFVGWSGLTLLERAALINDFVTQLEARRDMLADALSWGIGRPRPQADEVGRLRAVFEGALTIAAEALEPRTIHAHDSIERYVTHDPIGLCLSICAWNFPVAMLGSLVLMPLLVGNVVILKHAPQTAIVGDIVNAAAAAAGLPDGVLSALDIAHADCESLIEQGHFPLVQFIGSTNGGRAVGRSAGAGLARAGLELGGSDPAYVRPDVAIEAIVPELIEGSFGNAGQSCCSVERLYVHEEVYDDFLDAFVEAARIVTVGHPIDAPAFIGPLVNTAAAARVRRIVGAAVECGAREILAAGRSKLASPDGAYLEARILMDVDHRMDVIRQEVFGPVVSVIKVRSDADAVALMNDSDYGLTASIWSADVQRAVALGRQVRSGTFYVNRCDHADLHLPWGGVKQSGVGCTYAVEGLRELTATRAWHVRKGLQHARAG